MANWRSYLACMLSPSWGIPRKICLRRIHHIFTFKSGPWSFKFRRKEANLLWSLTCLHFRIIFLKKNSTVFYLQVYLSFELLIHCSVGLHSGITLKAFSSFPVCLLDGTKAPLIAKHIKALLHVALSLLNPAVKQFVSLWFACCVQDLSVFFSESSQN